MNSGQQTEDMTGIITEIVYFSRDTEFTLFFSNFLFTYLFSIKFHYYFTFSVFP